MRNSKQVKLDEYYQMIREDKQLNVPKMKDEAEELLRYSYLLNDAYGQAFAYLHLAIYYITLHNLESAYFNLAKAKTLCKGNEYHDLLVSCYFYEGTICQLNGEKIKAIRVYGKAMNLAEKQQENKIKSILYNNIAVILMDYEDMELAKEYFEHAVAQLLSLPNQQHDLVQVYANLVQVCCVLQDNTMAHHYLEKANTINFDNEKAASSIKASELYLYANEHKLDQIEKVYREYLEILQHCKASEKFFASDMLVIAKSLLIANRKVDCLSLLMRIKELVETNLELELQLYKLFICFYETYDETNLEVYERYYHLLMQSENQEYSSLAESLRGRIQLSEMNQKQYEMEKENETLQKQAHLDEMTGTFNRRYFDKLLLKIHADSHVQKMGCIMLDIDHFKEYNDTYGHLQGDQILKQVAATMTKHTIKGIDVGRFGGDEFYCLCADLQDATIENYLEEVFADLQGQKLKHCMNLSHIVTVSAGYCNVQKDKSVINQILEWADQALYVAKEKGRNNFVKYSNS